MSFSVLALVFVVLYLPSHASQPPESIYTVQTGSFSDRESAQKNFDSIRQSIDEKNLDYLRIEKVGKFFVVRLGKFENSAPAGNVLKTIKPLFPSAFIMKAYFIDDRIVNLHQSPSLSEDKKVVEKTLQKSVPEETKQEVPDKTEKKLTVDSLEEQLKIISDFVEKKEYEKALNVLNEAITAQTESHELNGWYGTVLLKMKQPDKALPYFQKASRLSPGVPDYHNGIGYCLSFSDRFKEAIDEFTVAVALDPSHVDALTGLGIAYMKTGLREKALDIYNKLKELNMDNANMLLMIINTTS